MPPPTAAHQPLQLQVAPHRDALAPTQEAVSAYLVPLGLPLRCLYRVELVLEEALLNIILHGLNASDESGTPAIDLRVDVDGDCVRLHLRDAGRPFNPLAGDLPSAPSSIGEAVPGGLGLVLMRKLARAIDYQFVDGRNTLTVEIEGHPRTVQDATG